MSSWLGACPIKFPARSLHARWIQSSAGSWPGVAPQIPQLGACTASNSWQYELVAGHLTQIPQLGAWAALNSTLGLYCVEFNAGMG